MPPPDDTTAAPDPFALLGLERRFDLDESTLAVMAGQSLSPAAADAVRTLSEPESRADCLLRLLGGPDEAALPTIWANDQEMIDALRGRWAAARNDPAAAAAVRQAADAEWRKKSDRIAALFRALHGRDNPVVQRDRCRDVRMALNALRALRQVESAG